LTKETSLSFDLYVRRENAFGMVCRMLSDKKENIDLYIAIGDDGKHYPMCLVNESIYLLPDEIQYEQWVETNIRLSKENEITVSYGTSVLSIPYPVSEISDVRISFGLCPFLDYTIYDIASANIRNIKIFNNEKQVRHWKLEKYDGNISYDLQASVPAHSKNARWIADDYSTWECFYQKQLAHSSLFTFCEKQEKLYILPFDQKDIILIYDLKSSKETVVKSKNNHQISSNCSDLVYDEILNRLIAYNLEEESLFIFSFDSEMWSDNGNYYFSTGKYGSCYNSIIYSSSDSLLYLFGGYGYLKYYNGLTRLNIYSNSITYHTLEEVTPRSYASITKIGDTLYLFGGRGSKTGRQEVFPQNYIDLYAVDLTSGKADCLWKINNTDTAFYPGENMIYNENEKCFYTVTDENDLTLIRFKKNTPGYETVSYSTFDHTYPVAFYRSLYFSSDAQKFYALTARNTSTDDWLIELHALNYPPVLLNPPGSTTAGAGNFSGYLWAGSVVVLLSACLILFLLRKHKNNKPLPKNDFLKINLSDTSSVETTYDFSRSAIRLLGEFCITDASGNDITKQFSPTLKDIFVLLFLNSESGNMGLTSKELVRLFWYDKDKEAAKNNRNVYFSRLRSILFDMNRSEIVNVQGSWKINPGPGVICDYTEALKALHQFQKEPHQTENIHSLLGLLQRGVLLPNIENEWIDGFKRNFSDKVIDVLTGLSQSKSHHLDDKQKLQMADILFSHDYLSEEALFLKCSVLIYAGKKGSAKDVYNNFCKEHFNFLKMPYKYSLSDVLFRKNFNA
jgi:two-component SAPR family response regulator